MFCDNRKFSVHWLVVRNMAEVSPRLFGTGFCRFIVSRTNPNRPVCVDRGSECLLIHCSRSLARRKSTQDQVVSKRKATQKKAVNQQKNVTLFGSSSCDLSLSSWIRCDDSRKRLHPFGTTRDTPTGLLQEKLLTCKMPPWSRGAVFIHHDTFRSPQQVRAFCTVLFILTEKESTGPDFGHLNFHSHPMRGSATTRGYSWTSKDAPPLHRSKTAYYDILKVSPSATQSQIKTAYYKQSFIYHPDKNPGGSKKATHFFSEISEAYTVLGNISLRKKYDRGILSHSDIQSAGRPTFKETQSRSTGSQQQQQRARRFSHVGGKPIFDFDAFYQAHYGEQLQKERAIRARRKQIEEMQGKKVSSWKQERAMELATLMIVTMAGLVCVALIKP